MFGRSQLIDLGGSDRLNSDYSAVAAKSRCVTGIVNIACIINALFWSGRRDSNPRPSAPHTDQIDQKGLGDCADTNGDVGKGGAGFKP
jgi:hypothetical protein